ncbi:glycosyltransferase [Nocardioides currus]|uniref:glycosyltransferase n=1 Tax=Nocardioides currus TaxID=2133958 RepID=UPI001057378B|nr:glycosyltransferase [Nocardioides currus]
MPGPRVVLISMYVGHEGVPHAGGRYLLELQRLLDEETDLTMLSVGNNLNRGVLGEAGVPRRLLLLGHEAGRGPLGRVLNRLAVLADTTWRHRRDPGMASAAFVLGLLRSPEARAAVREADVIDLQYSESIRLVRLLRRLNPRARITGTFHDVMSQSFSREPGDPDFWRAVAQRSRRHEAAMVRRLDEVLVFSAKDGELLRVPDATRVDPPLATGLEERHAPAPAPTVLVVSYLARDENDKAARWTLDEVWPQVRARVPGARLRLVGGGALPALVDRADREPDVVLTGFVDDLDEEYAAASVALVPVLQGAGVKFKAIEALLHGVPLVSTTVGLEGIEGPDVTAGLADDPAGLADALVAVLSDPTSAQRRADAAQRWAVTRYGRETFADTIRRSWVTRSRAGA